MEHIILEIKENFGDGKIKMKVISREPLSDYQKEYMKALRRDKAIEYGNLMGWIVLDIEDWV